MGAAGSEETLQLQVCAYIRMQYRDVIFHSDSAAGMRLTPGKAMRVRQAQSGRAWPDLLVAEPRAPYHGLFLELKREGTRIRLRDGSMTADAHIREQEALLSDLRKRGYAALMVAGFDAAKEQIDFYLKGAPHA